MDKQALHDELTEAFIFYQQRLDCPFPGPDDTKDMIILKYRTDPIFGAKVRSIVAGVMHIVSKHEDG